MRRLSRVASLARAATTLACREEASAAPSLLPRTSTTGASTSTVARSIARRHPSHSPWGRDSRSILSPLSALESSRQSFSTTAADSAAAAPSSPSAREREQERDDDPSTSTSTSTGAAATSSTSVSPFTPPAVSYVAPLASTVHRLKRLSLFSCVLTSAAAPALAAADTMPMPPAARALAAAGIAGFGLFTTGLLHWFVGPYVHELELRNRDSEEVEVTTLDVLGRRRKTVLPLSRVSAPPDGSVHPQATFCDSGTGKLYYVDVDNFVAVSAAAGGRGGGSDGGGRDGKSAEAAAAELLSKLVVGPPSVDEGGTTAAN